MAQDSFRAKYNGKINSENVILQILKFVVNGYIKLWQGLKVESDI